MSSSISLGTSVDLETLTSKSFTEIDKDIELFDCGNDGHVGGKSPKTLHVNREARDHKNKQSKTTPQIAGGNTNPKGRLELGDFYEEVDERMSRNSAEYPEQQAKYVGRWVNDMDFSKSLTLNSTPSETDEIGNVVGIRGFPKDTRGSKHGAPNKSDDQRSSYNRLKFNYSKLQTDYDKLQAHLSSTTDEFRRALKKRDHDIDLLKGFMDRRETGGRKSAESGLRCCCASNRCSHHQHYHHRHQLQSPSQPGNVQLREEEDGEELAKLKHEHRLLELKLSSLDRQHDERVKELLGDNDRLRNESNRTKSELDRELVRMRNQVEALSLEPDNKMIISLRQENSRLRNSNEIGSVELKSLKENYQQLEANLKALIDEQKRLTSDKDDEISKIMVELCRLQVYQPKLEATLDTERAIKVELQGRLEALRGENDHLNGKLDDLNRELNKERMRSKRIESNELETFQKELVQWQDKYYRLNKDKSDVEEMLRASRCKFSSLEARHRTEMDLVNEANRCEIGKLMGRNMKLEEHCNGLKEKLGSLEMKLDEYSVENNKLSQNILELNTKLAAATSNDPEESAQNLVKRLEDCEKLGAHLREQLEVSEMRNRQTLEEFERNKGQLDRSKQQVEQFRERFKLQQRALDEMKTNRDGELAKLRVSLNFERYNRQVALKGIEKELRSSLKELEAMKCRFSRRLATQTEPWPSSSLSSIIHEDKGGGGGCGGGRTTTTSTNRAAKSNGSR